MGPDPLPLSDVSREQAAERIFSEYRHMSPEEWAARFAHQVGVSSFDEYQYRNEALGARIYALHRILRQPDEVERYRRSFLSAEEYARVTEDEQEF
jgi:hypothetical protein